MNNKKPAIWLGVFAVVVLGYFILPYSSLLPAYMRKPAPPPLPEKERDEQWRQDLQYMASQLDRLHIDAFHSVTQLEFNQAIEELSTSIPELNDEEIVTGIMQIVALIDDAHTRVWPYGDDSAGFRVYPLALRWFGDDLYVINTVEAYQNAIGSRLVQIGDVSINDAFIAVEPLIPSENNREGVRTTSEYYLVTPEILYGLGIIENTETANFIFEDPEGNRFSITLSSPVGFWEYWGDIVKDISIADPPRYLQNTSDFYWFTYLEDTNTLYFQYNQCAEMEKQSFGDFNQALFDLVDERSVERIVVDLRHNSGGNSTVLNPFLNELKKRPAMNGHVTVLISRYTASSALIAATNLQRVANAVLVGEPTAANPNGYGNIKVLVLPNSGLVIHYSTKYFSLVDDPDANALVPDILIETTGNDYFSGHDPVLEFAVDYSGE